MKPEGIEYIFRLFVTGTTSNSLRAITNMRNICEASIPGRYSLEIIDVYQQPEIAQKEQLIALPLLVKLFPLPKRKLVGDLSDTAKVMAVIGFERL